RDHPVATDGSDAQHRLEAVPEASADGSTRKATRFRADGPRAPSARIAAPGVPRASMGSSLAHDNRWSVSRGRGGRLGNDGRGGAQGPVAYPGPAPAAVDGSLGR